jgi:hypothetical protein
MKIALPFIAFLLLPVTCLANDFPSRKAGLWEISTSMNMMGRAINQTMKQCIDAKTDEKLMAAGQNAQAQAGVDCTTPVFKKSGQKYTTDISCKTNGMTMVMKSSMEGDFTSSYTGETTITYDPPLPVMGEQVVTLSAHWVGPCTAGQKPGDMVMPNGQTMNVLTGNS